MSLGGASPLSPTNFKESKPQQTGTGLLIRYGEVATTSGSTTVLPGRLISRTPPFEGGHVGANPAPAAKFKQVELRPLGGEIASRLAYTQKSREQNLPGRPLPRGVIRSAPVSDTGGPGAKPGEAANFPGHA